MQVKSKNGLKVVIIAVALLLCLALAIGITGAFYQAKRQATGTLSMDQGIVIDYKGFGKTPDEGIWSRDTTTKFLLFSETNAQPGEQIAVNAAGIRANEKSVNFYARVKLSYKFYNNGTEVTTLPNASDLITTSANFFGTNWVESGDGYFYYATGSTLNKFEKGAAATTPFVDLFATDAKFIIEGEGFTLENGDLEGGGFVVGETSINKIEVYLTLETLQGDATAEQAKALGWEITTGGTEGENVVELTPEDYTSTTTTDETTGEEKTIYTPSETFVGKNPKYAFKFALNETEKTATITGPVGKPTELDIPSKLVVNDKSYITKNIGDSAFAECETLTTITIPNSVTSIGAGAFIECGLTTITIPNSVTSIGAGAFIDCGLTSVTIGNSVKSIGDYAFGACTSLTSITIPDSVTSIGENAFSGCSGLTSVTIGSSVISIGNSAFGACTSLTSITIPDSVTSIGEGAFWSCTSLTSITIGNSVKSIEEKAFDECYALAEVYNLSNYITVSLGLWNDGKIGTYAKVIHTTTEEPTRIVKDLKNGIAYYVYEEAKIALTLFDKTKTSAIIADDCTEINQHAFEYCSSLTSAAIPSSVKSIGEYAFMYCSELTTITIESGVTSIGEKAFYGCEKLTSVTIGSGATSIGNKAFCDCSSLTSITIPASVTSIGENAFYGCGKLQPSTTEGNIVYLGNESNLYVVAWKVTDKNQTSYSIKDGCKIIYDGLFADCSSTTNINIPDSVTSIGGWAFLRCWGLTSITIPEGVTNIGDSAFDDCSGLTSITIPEGVTSIGYRVFMQCSGITSITIPNSVTSIGDSAFENCRNLTSIEIPEGVESIGEYAFQYCSGLTSIQIPDSVTSIGNGVFSGCSDLTSINVDSKNPKYHSAGNCLIETKSKTLIAGCKNSEIPSDGSVISIGESAFQGSGLTSITIPDSVTSIGDYTFQNCSGLTSVVIKGNITEIPYACFNGCSSLERIVLPSSVTTIGNSVFSGCSKLKTIYVDSKNATAITDLGLGFTKVDDTLYDENGIANTSGKYYKYTGAIA